ncbi:hypothetical protein B0J13DRAFT_676911 [Dactylonectria estremocensis]|uniref:Azaphilone pigments biosynthesis cluster protein L N-terminal domain-containing protein n=1 Tax=Dactylonectria estremocensis TaxID=1079267 RepID=A0A9P9ELL0_9HYPO|nr:hypothetical protein B0J13DRAFT_676911 [Dactylonectria estremocensis]
MEILGAAATLITLVGAALASTQALHQVLSAIKNGSQAVRSLSNEVELLQHLLERVSQLPIQDASEMSGMANQACLCAADVVKFKSRLEMLTHSGADSRSSRLWRRAKASINEKDLKQMQTVIGMHVSMLNLRLNLLQAKLTANMTQAPQIYRLLQQVGNDADMDEAPTSSTSLRTPPERKEVYKHTTQSTTLTTTDIKAVFGKLVRSAGHKERAVDSEGGLHITQHLETLLGPAQRHECEAKEGKTNGDFIVTEGCVLEELKLVANMLSFAPSVYVNKSEPPITLSTTVQSHIVEQHRKRKTIDLGEVNLTVSSTKRRVRCPQQRRRIETSIIDDETTIDTPSGITQNTVREFSTALLFKMAKSRHAVEVSVYQSLLPSDSFVCAAPRVSVINIRPRNSPVFQLAAHGKTVELMALVSRGGASWRDHDTRGWSLLHYALPHPQLCQFLIQRGLDVDEMVLLDEASTADSSVTPLHISYLRELHGTAEILLRGGGDPTIEVPLRHSVLHLASGRQTSSSDTILKHIFNIGAYYGVATTRASGASNRQLGGWSALLSACYVGDNYIDASDSEPRSNIRKISFLLEKGCSVYDTADDGSNCLHVFFSSRPSLAVGYSWKEAIVYLIRHGADVCGRDHRGWSVTSLAYGEAFDDECAQESGSYFGDLWDAVLDCCNRDILEFRKDHPRQARYSEEYKRADFEKLWEGREERCPYWDDNPWPELDATTELNPMHEGRVKRCRLPWLHGK